VVAGPKEMKQGQHRTGPERSGPSCEIFERFRAQTAVISQAEIHPRARLKTVNNI
jgi:hypothetical protein